MIPWMWNSGITLSERSDAVSSSDAAMLRADRARLRWRNGTILGRDVVPDVCSTSTWSSAVGRRPMDEGSTIDGPARSIDRPSPRTAIAIVPSGAAACAAGAPPSLVMSAAA